MNPIRACLISILCAFPLGCALAQAAPSTADLNAIHHQIDNLRKQQHATELNRNHAVDALRQSELAISTANRALAETNQRYGQTKAALAQLQLEIEAMQRHMSHEQQELSVLLRQLYITENSNSAHVLLNGGDPEQISRDMTYAGYLGHKRDQTIANLQQTAHTLAELSAQQQQIQAQLAQQRDQRQQQRQQLQAERTTRQHVLQQLGTEIQRQQQQLGTLQQNEARMNRLLQELARAAARRRLLQRKPGRKPEHAGYIANREQLNPPDLPANGLGLLKGHLPMPTRGELIHRFGTPREAGGTLWKGVFIKAPAGQPVISIAAGQVVFADWLRGFGNLIIVDHGAGYMSLYSDNETLYKRVGDMVKAGDVIASVGNTGGNNETGLYFELRYRSQAFDPGNWLVTRH